MPYPNELQENLTVFAPEPRLGTPALEALELLAAHGLVATRGLSSELAQRIVSVGQEEKIREFCPNDTERFSDPGTWVAKKRDLVAIHTEEGKPDQGGLVAYGWSGPETNKVIPGADITIALRVSSHGSRIAREIREETGATLHLGGVLTELVLASAVHNCGARPEEISFGVWESNQTSIANGERMGFTLDPHRGDPEERPTATGETIVDTRRYMLLTQHPLLTAQPVV